MDETIDKVAERLTQLEVSVAEGFHDAKARFHDAELRDSALSRKIDVNTDALRGDIQTVLEAVGELAEELRRTTTSIRKEHAADRDIFRLAIEQHSRRLNALEQ